MVIIGENPSTCKVERFLGLWHNDCDTVTVHTSGSTGIPKLIELSKTDMRISATATCDFFNITSDSLLFLPLPIDYIAGKMMVVRADVSGADLMIEAASNTPLQTCPPDVIDLAAIVPSQVPGLLGSKWVKAIRQLIVGGAPLSAASEELLVRSGIDAYATYGMTETASHVALRKLGQRYYEALPHISFDVDDRGCLIVNSSLLGFKSLTTNDIVRLVDDRRFEWVGRHDNVINSGGIKVQPENIEDKLAEVLAGRTYFITSRPSEKWGNEVVLVIEGDDKVDKSSITSLPHLIKAEVPKDIIYVNELKRTKSGKLIRKF